MQLCLSNICCALEPVAITFSEKCRTAKSKKETVYGIQRTWLNYVGLFYLDYWAWTLTVTATFVFAGVAILNQTAPKVVVDHPMICESSHSGGYMITLLSWQRWSHVDVESEVRGRGLSFLLFEETLVEMFGPLRSRITRSHSGLLEGLTPQEDLLCLASWARHQNPPQVDGFDSEPELV